MKADTKKNIVAGSIVVIGVLIALAVDKMFNVSGKISNQKMKLVG